MTDGKPRERVAAFIDGLNIYHAIDDLKRPHLKWVDLWDLCARYAAQPHQTLVAVYYFSTFATWKPGPYARHRAYVRALQSVGVEPVMGYFKDKDRRCPKCKRWYKGHEEKETDVNIGLYMLNEAYKDTYDHAFLLSNDSDLAPIIRMVKAEHPQKRIRLLTPPNKHASKDLLTALGGNPGGRTVGFRFQRDIKVSHIEANLLPAGVKDATGTVAVARPPEYDPPAAP